ncbi:MAG: class I SAM-dependent methyltransferase [Lachnospiraceae bacterium]|jgi:SAM-dependent methyltransferase|nr:class I SAM-dependent methyltransferase [Lachnospiraceae bacterium]MCI1555079.1 class I SAM-dependent methyltransferase [Lachnospiraceae bacterium]
MQKCLICGGKLHHLLSIPDMPASAQNIPDEDEVSSDKPITLNLCQCEECGLIQLDTVPVDYYKDVIRAGGGTTTMTRLRHEEYDRLIHFMDQYGAEGHHIVEIGCGKGEFLAMWKSLPQAGQIKDLQVCGIEHRKDLVDTANRQGLAVYEGFAQDGYAIPDGPFDAFVQFNFLEHQPYPESMLRCVRNNLKEGALGLVTVPSFEYIMKYDGYYELIRDHIANYDERTLRELFERCGFEALAERIVNRDTIEIIVRKSDKPVRTKSDFNGEYLDVSSLADNYEALRKDVDSYIRELRDAHRSLAMWGGSHQGFSLAASTDLKQIVKYIIDSAPFKQGRYSPASHIRIVSPDYYFKDPVDEILIVAPGYTDEIAGIIKDRYGDHVRIRVLKAEKIEDYRS